MGVKLNPLARMGIPSISSRIASARQSTGRAFSYLGKIGSKAASALVPRNQKVAAGAGAIAWYVGKQAAVCAPGYMASLCTAGTQAVVGKTLGAILGPAVITPLVVPPLVPVAVAGSSLAAGVVSSVALNCLSGTTESQKPEPCTFTYGTLETDLGEFTILNHPSPIKEAEL